MASIIMVTGGQRSGKSAYAQKLALSLCIKPTYLATSRAWDKEHLARIEKHKKERSSNWVNIEEDKKISRHQFCEKDVVVIDCVTLWATNFFFDYQGNIESSLKDLKHELDMINQTGATLIFVTNEIGLGGISVNTDQRNFADLQGYINQYIGSIANSVYLMISGIPLKIK